MIMKDYVSFEISKLLKEKGFNETCRTFYKSWNNEINLCDCNSSHCFEYCSNSLLEIYNDKDELNIAAPTHQRAIKWIEEVHHILVVVDYIYECTSTSWVYKIYRLGENGKPERCVVKGTSYDDDNNPTEHIVGYRDYELSYKDYATREEAEDEGIRYVLENLI